MPIGEMLLIKKIASSEKVQKSVAALALLGVTIGGVNYAGARIAESIKGNVGTSTESVGVGDGKVLDFRIAPKIEVATMTTEVEAVIVQEALERTGPDIVEGLISIGTQLDTGFALDGKLDVTEWVQDGTPHAEILVKSEDIKTYTTKTPGVEPVQIYGGNFVKRMQNIDQAVNNLFTSSDMQKAAEQMMNSEGTRANLESQKRQAEMSADYAIKLVDEKCAPAVFEASKYEIADSLKEALERPGEVLTVRFEEGIENAEISSVSPANKRIEERGPRTEGDGKVWKTELKEVNMGECTVDPAVLAKAKERQQADDAQPSGEVQTVGTPQSSPEDLFAGKGE